MFKIKLLILLLISIIISACTKHVNSKKYDISYIGGGVDGLILNNYLSNYLQMYDLYDSFSNYEIAADISHNKSLYIAQVNNTSDRELISSSLSINIKNKHLDCFIYKDNKEAEQFYVITSAVTYGSDNRAIEEIKIDNTENLILQLINDLPHINDVCMNDTKY